MFSRLRSGVLKRQPPFWQHFLFVLTSLSLFLSRSPSLCFFALSSSLFLLFTSALLPFFLLYFFPTTPSPLHPHHLFFLFAPSLLFSVRSSLSRFHSLFFISEQCRTTTIWTALCAWRSWISRTATFGLVPVVIK